MKEFFKLAGSLMILSAEILFIVFGTIGLLRYLAG